MKIIAKHFLFVNNLDLIIIQNKSDKLRIVIFKIILINQKNLL